jgi:hypothetical protein
MQTTETLPPALDHVTAAGHRLRIARIGSPDAGDRAPTEAAHVFVEDCTIAGIERAAVTWRDTDLPRRLARYHGDQAESVFRGSA